MQAIQTKYYGPTNTHGSKLIAKCAARKITVAWDHRLNVEDNHIAAAQLLQIMLGWDKDAYGTLVSGCLADGSFAHVFAKAAK